MTKGKKKIFLPYYMPFYSSYLTKLNLYKFVHIALKGRFTNLKKKNEQNIRNVKPMLPFAIFVQSIYQLKAFGRYEKTSTMKTTDHSVPFQAICNWYTACIHSNLKCKIQIPLYRNVKLQSSVKN